MPKLKDKLNDTNINGYSINANLLENIVEIGIYCYCPYDSMVRTIFINSISNLITEISLLNALTVND